MSSEDQVQSAGKRVKVGIVGGTGYTGVELLRLLSTHPDVVIACVTSRAEAGTAISSIYPNLRGVVDIDFQAPDNQLLKSCDLVFFATPNGIAMQSVRELLDAGVKVIDLAADFRIKDLKVWSQWYGMSHSCPDLVDSAVYGLPEINRAEIASARLVANPGCYPTAVQLAAIPVLNAGLTTSDRIIADAKSGASGAGRQARVDTLFAEAGESFKAYGASGHRHLPEIKQGLESVAGKPVKLTFVPHLVPMIRGIEATVYIDSDRSLDELQALYSSFYDTEPFVDVMPVGTHPETRSVKGANFCRMALHRQPESEVLIVSSVIDNLVKGAAGQAVQNMNIMLGLNETAGLNIPALLP